jgi:hypothetical protein
MAPSEELEGECDENPIRLQGDSVEEVRALIGYLYSLCVLSFPQRSVSLQFRLQTTRGSERSER